MRIRYCKKYEKYVSQQHCEFFNDGSKCEFYGSKVWTSIKELMLDADRPKMEVNTIIKPLRCNLLNREHLNERNRRRRAGRSLIAGRL